MSTTVEIQGVSYALRKPTLIESLRFKALSDALTGEDQILLWFWGFGTLADGCPFAEQGTVTLTGGWVMEALRERHPSSTPAELWAAALDARDAFLAAFVAPVDASLGNVLSNEDNRDEAVALGNSLAGLPKVDPSYVDAGTPVSGMVTQAEHLVP